jgi:phospholipase C
MDQTAKGGRMTRRRLLQIVAAIPFLPSIWSWVRGPLCQLIITPVYRSIISSTSFRKTTLTTVISGLTRDPTAFYQDLQSGTLPQVCWLVPVVADSEHPPADVQTGMWYVTNLINAVMQSPYWQSAAIIVVWDHYGGFYDRVPPQQTDKYGFGPRVPALVVSPFSRSGVICHQRFDLTSPLKLIETRFGLKPLTHRDAESNDMLDCFDFHQRPLSPDVITTSTELDFSDLKTTTP